MIIKLKKRGFLGHQRMATTSKIDDILVKENLLAPEKEQVNIYFRGSEVSGILELNRTEIETLMNSLKSSTNLVKKSKVERV